MKLLQLRYFIEQSWTKESSFCPDEWSEKNPSYGQCVVTTVLLYKLLPPLGYDVMMHSCMANDRRHYFVTINTIPFDATICQFKAPVKITNVIDHYFVDEVLDKDWKIKCFEIFEQSFKEQTSYT